MKNYFVKLYFVFFAAISCLLFSYFLSQKNNYTTQQLAERAELALHKKEVVAKKNSDVISLALKTNSPKKTFQQFQNKFNDLYQKEGIAIYAYHHDSLCFWSDNQPAIDLYAYTNEANVQLIKIRNGWYEYIKQVDSVNTDYTVVALIAIKPEYDFENKYLSNRFSDWLNLPDNTKIVTPINYLAHAVKSKFGAPLFEIQIGHGLYQSPQFNFYISFLYVLAFVLFGITLYLILKIKVKNEIVFVVLFGSILFVFRSLMIYFKMPAVFYDTNLYNAKIFANASSFYFSYLGDVLINSSLLFFVAIVFYKSKLAINFKSKISWGITIIIGLCFIGFFSVYIRNLIYSLVNNSTISYNINELFNFSAYSLVGLLSVGFLMFSLYLFIEKMILLFVVKINTNKIVAFSIVMAAIFVAFIIGLNKHSVEYIWPLLFIFISYFLRKNKATYNFINIGLIVLATTFIVSTLFSKYEQVNKKETFEAISLGLTDRQDVVAENEFNKISVSIKKDIQLKNLLSLLPLSIEQIEQSLRQRNFSGYFERYEIVMSLFKNDCTPVFINLNPIYLNEDYFKQQIEKGSSQTICDDLFFINNDKKSVRYIAKIDIEDINKNSMFHLYLQLEPKQVSNLGTFPDLLLDKSLENKLESKHISYAVYQSNKLFNTFGEYQYPLFINDNTFKLATNDGFEHFVFSSNKNEIIIITDKEFGVLGRFTSNSYLFVFFSIIAFLCIWFNAIVILRRHRFNSLNSRIQFILVSVVVLSLASVVIGTVWVVSSQFELKNKNDLILKSQSVLRELQQTVGQQDVLESSYKDNTSFRLKRLSQLFGSDISLFNKKGMLYATSQPAVYEQGLVSKFMNPLAFMNLTRTVLASYSQKETIGTLKYLSAYIPFYSKNDKLLGYINLPYFSRQKDLEKELTAYLTTLINIYTILFAITTLIALLLSNLLTKPLRIIKQQMSNFQFGKFNETLKWNSNDEIGNLVKEYNLMLIKLGKSSELLAQSERESAWREMAKQVAHEIKNPLTPMKLNIQHLQRVVETHPEDITERVKRVSEILIEQIDTLSHIATEFSNFAKLPNANLEEVNLFDVLQNVTYLFQQNTACEITFRATETLLIMADKEQCLRVFTNLLKNAEQSIPEKRKGEIEVEAFLLDEFVHVNIKDNGCGILDEVKHKLFTPNFTTKSTGTGLGLAMVKNTVNSFNGTITFETQINIGTTFEIVFPTLKH